jgi:hypothetical protein
MRRQRLLLGPRSAYLLVALLLLVILVLLPFAVGSVVTDVAEQSNRTFRLGQATDRSGIHAGAHVDLVGLDEWDGQATLRVTLHQSCGATCPWGDRLRFVSVLGDEGVVEELPPSQTVTIPATSRDVTQTIKLPVFGDPIRYPFDRYQLAVGVIVERLLPDGTAQPLSPEQATRYLSLDLRARVPRIVMGPPQPLDGARLQADADIEPYAYVGLVVFSRPLYLQILTILLVLLVTAAAAYAVFLRPLDQLIINAGALVLGVWGIRAILLGSGLTGITAVDLSLSVVILFLLVAMSVRTLWLLEEQSGLRLLRRRPAREPAAGTGEPPDYVPDRTAGLPEDMTTAVTGRPWVAS